MNKHTYGFRVVGPTTGQRRLVDARRAFDGYCQCDDRAEVGREGYLSAFTFGKDFRGQLESTGSTAGFRGVCGALAVWWDIDRESDLQTATDDCRRLAGALVERYRLGDDDLLVFFSGSKGFHIGLPTGLWTPEPSATFHQAARCFAEHVAGLAGVAIDTGVYDRVRCFRAPNSRHPKTGLHKRRLTVDELMGLRVDAITKLAEQPESFELDLPTCQVEQLADDWAKAIQQVATQATANRERLANGPSADLNRATLDFIRDGASNGDRHRLLYSAAANLAEYVCPPRLVHALLTDSARDCGLTPSDISRAIDNALGAVGKVGNDG